MKLQVIVLALLFTGIVEIGGGATRVAFAAESQTKTGTVKKVDAAAKQIVVMVTRELTFTATDSTKIQNGDKDIKLADIEVGATVTVDYVKDGETRNASKIALTKKEEKKEEKKEPKKEESRAGERK